MKFAIIEIGGKQYKVSPGQKFKIEKLNVAGSDKIIFDKVLLEGGDGEIKIGTPNVAGAKVEAKILKNGRGERKMVFRYHSKTRYRKKKTHRQPYTEVEILKV